MSLSDSFRFHAFSNRAFVVGGSGPFSSITDALGEAAALDDITNVVTATCSLYESTAGGTLDKRILRADSGTPFSGFNIGDVVGVKVDGSTTPVLATVYTATTLLFRHPFIADVTSVSCGVGLPAYKAIILMPGHEEEASGMDVSSFTTIQGFIRGTSRIYSTTGSNIFNVPEASNEVRFKDFEIRATTTSGSPQPINWANHHYQGDTYVEGLDGYSTGQDFFFFANANLGGVHVSGCNITSGYDTFRLRTHREVNIVGNVFDTFSLNSGIYAQASAIALGANSVATPIPVSRYNIRGNTLKSFGQDLLASTILHGDVRTIDIRNLLHSNAFVNIQGNEIYATGDTAGAVVGLNVVGSAAGETPTINSVDNIYDVRNDGAGAQISMTSAQANYTIDRAGNTQLSGCTTGTNTAALTRV